MPKKFDAATVASGTIIDAMDRAREHLWTGDRCFNGLGILPDPSNVYSRLHDAEIEIKRAISAYRATDWPTREDYDAAEGANR